MTFLNKNYLVIPWFIPFFFYESALFFMYNLSKLNKNKKFNKYTGWSRLQIISCLPFLLFNDESKSIAADLIWTNSIGCYLTIHGFYLIVGPSSRVCACMGLHWKGDSAPNTLNGRAVLWR